MFHNYATTYSKCSLVCSLIIIYLFFTKAIVYYDFFFNALDRMTGIEPVLENA
jgi:hypothetical protein